MFGLQGISGAQGQKGLIFHDRFSLNIAGGLKFEKATTISN